MLTEMKSLEMRNEAELMRQNAIKNFEKFHQCFLWNEIVKVWTYEKTCINHMLGNICPLKKKI